MELVHVRVAGMDISKKDAKVCVRIAPVGGGKAKSEVTTWGAMSSQILALGEYLLALGVTLVVMEATSSYWKPFWHILTGAGLEVMLVNARQARQIPGRKTDVNDAQWLAELGAHGLLRGSFVPPAEVREVKDLVRTRTVLVRMRGQEIQRLEKLLEDSAIKLSSVITDVMGVSGRAMLEALRDGERDPAKLAALGDPRLKATPEVLAEALTGRFTDHHAFLVGLHLEVIDHHAAKIAELDARIARYFPPQTGHDAQGADTTGETQGPRPGEWHHKRELLTTIPGVSYTVAEEILAEIGPDMTPFATPGHLASWTGVAPGSNESAGKVKSSKCRKGDTYLKGALGVAALAAVRTKDTFASARYKRIRSRRGHMKALVAIERHIIEAVWHILTTGEPYRELGGDYYIKRRPGTAIRKAVDQLRAAGFTVTFPDTDTAAITPAAA
jgi:transposase